MRVFQVTCTDSAFGIILCGIRNSVALPSICALKEIKKKVYQGTLGHNQVSMAHWIARCKIRHIGERKNEQMNENRNAK